MTIDSTAIVLRGPHQIGPERLRLTAPEADDVVIDISHSGISTGTEKLFWDGKMPPFPGMGYPLVPGYEAVGEVVESKSQSINVGDRVFVPGASCFGDVRGLFGGAASRLVTPAERVIKIDPSLKAQGALLALAATARHAIAGLDHQMPELIVGHGVLGRLLARLTIASGAPAPVVWDIDTDRMSGAQGYEVVHPDADPRRDYNCIFDVTGDASLLDTLIGRIAKGGEIVLAGFYADPLSFTFPMAFMKEARLRVAAEWMRDDMIATRELVDAGVLSLDGLITHTSAASDADAAYAKAFNDKNCLKMILEWGATA